MQNLQEYYKKSVIPALKKAMSLKNDLEVPKVTKIVLNVGVGKHIKEPQFVEKVQKNIERITGQKSVLTKAKVAISNFKIREGNTVGVMVTLRGKRMYDFLEKLIKVTLPRVRDFRGISKKGFDKMGNYSLGFREHMAFPEIKSDEVDTIHGLQVNIQTSACNKEDGIKLLEALGLPFQK